MYGNSACGNWDIPWFSTCRWHRGARRKGRWPHAGDARPWEVGQLHSTEEAAEQRGSKRLGGGSGGKAADQGEHAADGQIPDTEPGKSVDRPAACARSRASASSPCTRGRSRMRENCTYGSARGAPGNRWPYREQPADYGQKGSRNRGLGSATPSSSTSRNWPSPGSGPAITVW